VARLFSRGKLALANMLRRRAAIFSACHSCASLHRLRGLPPLAGGRCRLGASLTSSSSGRAAGGIGRIAGAGDVADSVAGVAAPSAFYNAETALASVPFGRTTLAALVAASCGTLGVIGDMADQEPAHTWRLCPTRLSLSICLHRCLLLAPRCSIYRVAWRRWLRRRLYFRAAGSGTC